MLGRAYSPLYSIPGVCNGLERRAKIDAMMAADIWDSGRRISDEDAAAFLRLRPGFVQASLSDPEERASQIVAYMTELIHGCQGDPLLEFAWRLAWDRFHVFAGDVAAIVPWWFAKYWIRKFVHHQDMLIDWLGLPNELQLLISPDALLRLQDPKGDCAVYTTLICALLELRGIPWEIVTVAVNPMYPAEFSHVYPQAALESGERIPLDASHGKFPGWQAPAFRVLKKKCGTARATWSHRQEAIAA
jgi:hypothetical protein